MMIRTTITLPEDLYEKLRHEAFFKKKAFSVIIRNKLTSAADMKQVKRGASIEALIKLGKHLKKTKYDYKFNRVKLYDEIIKHKLSFGH